MNSKLLQKIEELTLYAIEEQKKNIKQSEEIFNLKEEIKLLKKQIKSINSISERLLKLEQKLN
ncbi:hypothetical protein [Flavobacterium ginsengiterrae]|uniref:Cell division protein ZapB n=1 Tax=Flavobacterium ginsengiterrae TaxID=871695 RepID=A0ABP7GUV2_9FLAO